MPLLPYAGQNIQMCEKVPLVLIHELAVMPARRLRSLKASCTP